MLCSRSARWQMNSLQIWELWCNLSTQGEQISPEERAKCSFLIIIGLFSYLLPLVAVAHVGLSIRPFARGCHALMDHPHFSLVREHGC